MRQNGLKLSTRTKTVKLSEESIGIKLCYLGLGSSFLDIMPKAEITREKV